MAKEKETPQVEEQEVPQTIEERMEAVESVVMELITKVEELAKNFEGFKKTAITKPKGLFGGKRTPSPMKDLKTGKVYPSKAAVGKAFAAEAGGDPLDTMVYYTVIKTLKMPDGADRFVEAPAEEAAKAREEYQKQVQAEVDRRNAELDAEAAKTQAEKKAEAQAPTVKVAPAKGQPQVKQETKKK